jgi:hypothetical protein
LFLEAKCCKNLPLKGGLLSSEEIADQPPEECAPGCADIRALPLFVLVPMVMS